MLAEHFPAATRIIKQGDVGDKFYFIREGHVTVRREGVEAPIANLGPGDFFGEAALIKGESRNAHVDADENVVLFTLNKDQFTKAIDNQPTIDEEIRKALFDDQ
jgi:putative ABC transport system ATP-binding protein